MPLSTTTLANQLESRWMSAQPPSVEASAATFASVVGQWFAGATANMFPCTTATARVPLLAIAAVPALSAGAVEAASLGLGGALVGYIVGQMFGVAPVVGVAGAPLAVVPAVADLQRAFGTAGMQRATRAELVAGAIALLVSSTLVVFPPISLIPPAAIA